MSNTSLSLLNRPIAIFAYSFPHKKTFDFLVYLKSYGFTNICVIAAPKVKLKASQQSPLFTSIPTSHPGVECKLLCSRLGYNCIEAKHSEHEVISKFLLDNNCLELAIVSGARILNEEIISLFEMGIINFHPGRIPETSGLDSFYWMIENDALPGTTVHFIDHKVDAGDLIFFHECEINVDDSIQAVSAKIYNSQLNALNRLLNLLNCLPNLKRTPLHRPNKNLPMSVVQKKITLKKFDEWKLSKYSFQKHVTKILRACETGNLKYLEDNFHHIKGLIVDNNGWTPLIIAAFNQNKMCVKYLIDKNQDINANNDKGTSVFMYSKSELVNSDIQNLDLIELLLKAGADRNHKDLFGKDVFSYIEGDGDHYLAKKIKEL